MATTFKTKTNGRIYTLSERCVNESNNEVFYNIYLDGAEAGRIEKSYLIGRYGKPCKTKPYYVCYDKAPDCNGNKGAQFCQGYSLKEAFDTFVLCYERHLDKPKTKKTSRKKKEEGPNAENETLKFLRKDMELHREQYKTDVELYVSMALEKQSTFELTDEQKEEAEECGECFCVSVPLRHETVTLNISKVTRKDDGKYYVDGEVCDSEYDQSWYGDVYCNEALSDLEGLAAFIQYWYDINNEE